MGISEGVFRLLLRERRYLPRGGRLLTFGVQDIWFSYDRAIRILDRAGEPYDPVPPSERRLTTSPFLRRAFGNAGFMHQETLFRLLGVGECRGLDRFDTEGAVLVHDMNRPIPSGWHASCDVFLDVGSLEHVFDIRSCMANIHDLLKPGGAVIHGAPVQGAVDHGFYQFSPTLFFEAYGSNGYGDPRGFIVESPYSELPGSRCDATPYHPGDRFAPRRPHHPLTVFYFARKPLDPRPFEVVQQGRYGVASDGSGGAYIPEPRWKGRARNVVRRIDAFVPASLFGPWLRFTRRATPGRGRIRL